jgi:hypothetical protein
MKTHSIILMLLAALAAMTLASVPAAADDEHGHEHAGDFVVGVDSTGKLKVEAPIEHGHDHVHVLLDPVAEGSLYTGFISDAPGYDYLRFDEPDEDFYGLSDGASIFFEVLEIDPGLVIRNTSGVLLADEMGDTALIGDHELHTHFIYHAASANVGDTFHLQIKLIDSGSTTEYGDSDPIELHVEAVPEPASLSLLATGALAVLRRRRRQA